MSIKNYNQPLLKMSIFLKFMEDVIVTFKSISRCEISLLALIWLLFLSLIAIKANATNPNEVGIKFAYKNGSSYSAILSKTMTTDATHGFFFASQDNYDNCKTTRNNPFDHGHFKSSDDFPFLDENITVTATMSDNYWKDTYSSNFSGGTGSTFTQNCHGYATGKSMWLGGIAKVREDDYSDINPSSFQAQDLLSDDNHSKKVGSALMGYIVSTSEKMGSGPIFTRSYNFPFACAGEYWESYGGPTAYVRGDYRLR